MRLLKSCLVVMCCLSIGIGTDNAQTKKYITLPHHDSSTAQGMEGGMWRIDENFESILQLKNVLVNHSITATPVLYMEDGTAYPLPAVTLEPAGVASVNLGAALAEMPANLAAHRSLYGMVGVKYNWSWPAAVMALVRNIDEAEMVSFYSNLHSDQDVAESPASPQKPQEIEGLWWKPYQATDGFLFLSNTLLKPVQATVLAYDASGKLLHQQSVTLGTHQSVRLILSDVLGGQQSISAMGSLRIIYQGPDFGLSAVGGLEDDTNGYSASLNLQEMHPEHARNQAVHQVVLDAPGIMFGMQDPMMQFPENTSFTPYGYLHNTSNQARQVSVTATLTGSKGPQTYTLAALTLAPGSTQQIDYKDILKGLNLPSAPYIDISTSYQGNDGDVLVEEGSVDQTGNYVFQVEPQTEGWTISKTLCHWELHGETDSMISLWNYSSSPEDLKLTFYYTGGKYVLPVHLQPRADYELDLATLVHSAQPDASGSIIPPSITEGSAILSDAADDRNHIDVASSTAVFNVRTATCGVTCQYCNGVSEYIILPNPIVVVPIGNTGQDETQTTYNTGAVYYATSGNWSSNNTSIGTINSNGVVTAEDDGEFGTNIFQDNVPSPAGYICLGGNASCPVYNVSASGGGEVPPALSLSNALFYNGGLALPSTFTEAKASAVVTASGASGGSYAWSLSSSSGAIASFSSSSSVTSTTTSSNTITVYAAGASKSLNDLTITLKWTPSGGSAITATTTTQIDSPYDLSLQSQTPLAGAETCKPPPPTPGGLGWYTVYQWGMESYFGNPLFGMSVNEDFTAVTVYQQPGYNGFSPNGSAGQSGVFTFKDTYCAAYNPDGSITTEPPQNPLTTDAVDSALQTYRLGSTTVGSGTTVQTQTLTRYRDHATVTNIAR